MPVPTDEAWNYFLKHKDDIRDVCAAYLPVDRLEVPNTRMVDATTGDVAINERGEEQRGTVPLKVTYTLADFDAAVEAKDSVKLTTIMNRAWLGAPESRSVYSEPGFSEMCNLLDCTVDGFFDEPDTRDYD